MSLEAMGLASYNGPLVWARNKISEIYLILVWCNDQYYSQNLNKELYSRSLPWLINLGLSAVVIRRCTQPEAILVVLALSTAGCS
jgi:hypothetical protein